MYGENSGLLRDSLRELLTQHRIQQRIGGPGIHTVPETTTLAEREEIGEQIGRYRHAVLVWCHQAMFAASPNINLERTRATTRSPVVELRYRLEATINNSPSTRPTLDELTTERRFPLVESWRQAARACALGENDFGAGIDYGRLSDSQCLTVVHDAAEVTRALVGLDRRYAYIPGWRALKEPGRLDRAAQTCVTWAGYGEPDYTVDLRGWKPAPSLIEGPALPGISGVIQAQHNLLLHLGAFPTAQNLRVVLDSQRIVSREAARRLEPLDPALAAGWERRGKTYGRLVRETRDIGGMVGNGSPGAGQASLAAVRMQKLPAEEMSDPKPVKRLKHISAGIDERVCDTVEDGIKERLYFQRVLGPGRNNDNDELVSLMGPTYLPITSPARTELLTIVRSELRPTPVQRKSPQGAARSRLDFEATLNHRPPPRGANPDVPSI